MRICLMKEIVDINNQTRCNDELWGVAFDSHYTCYVDHGCCTDIMTSYRNMYCLLVEVLDWGDLLNMLTIRMVSTFTIVFQYYYCQFVDIFRQSTL